jgi:hypothetical protein
MMLTLVRRTAISTALLVGTTGCFLPIPFTEGVSPPLAGRYVTSAGLPIVGRHIAVSTGWSDSTCTRATQRTSTDSAGRFFLERTTIRRRGVLLFPAIERFGNSYWLCVGASDSTLGPLYAGYGSLNERAPLDSVSCVQWQWDARPRTTCTGSRQHVIAAGGHWSDGHTDGFYRIILTEEPISVRPCKNRFDCPHAYLQWIEDPGTGPPFIVRATVDLDLDPKITALHAAYVRQRDGRTYAVLSGTRPKFMSDFASIDVRFDLGPPGAVTPVNEP